MAIQNKIGRAYSPTMGFYLNNVNGITTTSTSYAESATTRLLFNPVSDYQDGVRFRLRVYWKNSGTNTNYITLYDQSNTTDVTGSEITATMGASNTLQVSESGDFAITGDTLRAFSFRRKVSAGTMTIVAVQLVVSQDMSFKGILASYVIPRPLVATVVTVVGGFTINWSDFLCDIDDFPATTKARITVYWKHSATGGTLNCRLFDQFGAAAVADSTLTDTAGTANVYQISRTTTNFDLVSGLTSYMIQLWGTTGTKTIGNIQVELIWE